MLNGITIKTFGPNFNNPSDEREFLIELKNFYHYKFQNELFGTRLNIEVRAMTEHGPLTLLRESIVGKSESYTHRVKIDEAHTFQYVSFILDSPDDSKTEVVSITEVEDHTN